MTNPEHGAHPQAKVDAFMRKEFPVLAQEGIIPESPLSTRLKEDLATWQPQEVNQLVRAIFIGIGIPLGHDPLWTRTTREGAAKLFELGIIPLEKLDENSLHKHYERASSEATPNFSDPYFDPVAAQKFGRIAAVLEQHLPDTQSPPSPNQTNPSITAIPDHLEETNQSEVAIQQPTSATTLPDENEHTQPRPTEKAATRKSREAQKPIRRKGRKIITPQQKGLIEAAIRNPDFATMTDEELGKMFDVSRGFITRTRSKLGLTKPHKQRVSQPPISSADRELLVTKILALPPDDTTTSAQLGRIYGGKQVSARIVDQIRAELGKPRLSRSKPESYHLSPEDRTLLEDAIRNLPPDSPKTDQELGETYGGRPVSAVRIKQLRKSLGLAPRPAGRKFGPQQ